MGNYILRRILIAIPSLLGISVVLYTVLALAPGDPFGDLAANPNVPPEVSAALRTKFGLDDPVLVRYVRWLLAMLHGAKVVVRVFTGGSQEPEPSLPPPHFLELKDGVYVLPDKSAPVVVYGSSAHSLASATAQEKLGRAGYTNARDFRGGLEDWECAGLPVERGSAPPAAPRPREGRHETDTAKSQVRNLYFSRL